MAAEGLKYAAFISYSHADEAWAKWLHQKLERYRVPSRLVGRQTRTGTITRRIGRCFRDQVELSAASHLGETLQEALQDSQVLIVVCSPRSATSHWVDEEVKFFRSLGREHRIYALIVDGHPNASDPAQECFPPTLRGAHPLAADARESADGKADGFLKLTAGILGLGFDELRRREHGRRMQLMALSVAATLVIAVTTTALALWAIRSRNEAQDQRARTERVKDFLITLFNEQDPLLRDTATARTPQQMISDAARKLDAELGSDPQVHAELLDDLGGIENTIGDTSAAAVMLERALEERTALYGGGSLEVASTLVKLATGRLMQSKMPEAEQLARRALAIFKSHGDAESVEVARVKSVLAEAVSHGNGAPPEAEALFVEARGTMERKLGLDAPDTLSVVAAQAIMHTQARQLDRAEPEVREVVARYQRRYGDPSVQLAHALGFLGDVLASERKLVEAVETYQRAAAMHRQFPAQLNDDLAHVLSTMAVQLRDLRRFEEAEQAYAEAARVLPAGNDMTRGDVLRGRGRVALVLHRAEEAERYLREAYELRRKGSGDSNAFTWYYASEYGRGLAAIGKLAEAERIQREALAKLEAIMGPEAYQNALLADALAETLEMSAGKRKEAEDLRRHSLKIVETKFPRTSPVWADYALKLSHDLAADNTPAADAEGMALAEQSLATCRGDASNPEALARALVEHATFLAHAHRMEQARSEAAEALEALKQVPHPDEAMLASARSLAGGSGR